MKIIGLTGLDAEARDRVADAVMESVGCASQRSFNTPLVRALIAARHDMVIATQDLFGLELTTAASMHAHIPKWDAVPYQLVAALRSVMIEAFGRAWDRDVVSYLTPESLAHPEKMGKEVTPCRMTGGEVLARFRASCEAAFGEDLLIQLAAQEMARVAVLSGSLPQTVLVFDDVTTDAQAQWLRVHGAAVVAVNGADEAPGAGLPISTELVDAHYQAWAADDFMPPCISEALPGWLGRAGELMSSVGGENYLKRSA